MSSSGRMRAITPLLPWRPAILSPTLNLRFMAMYTFRSDDLDRRPVLEVRHVLFGQDAGDNALVAVAPGHLVADAQLALHGDVHLQIGRSRPASRPRGKACPLRAGCGR